MSCLFLLKIYTEGCLVVTKTLMCSGRLVHRKETETRFFSLCIRYLILLYQQRHSSKRDSFLSTIGHCS